jgi:FKBP-type peptidyl-prolyl cis-trans isomerase
MQLSPYLIGDPSSLAEKEQNTIINYAIDRLIPIKKSDTGLFYQVLEPGEGDFLKWGDYVSAHYKGYFLDGQIFDSSYRRDQPLEFYIGNMVPGWNEGLQLLKPGGKILLLLPSALAYGEKGFPDGKEGYLVPPNQILAFEVEVLEKLKSGK